MVLLTVANAANTNGGAYPLTLSNVTYEYSAPFSNNNNVVNGATVLPGKSKQSAYMVGAPSKAPYQGSVTLNLYNESNPSTPIQATIDLKDGNSDTCVPVSHYSVTVNYSHSTYYGTPDTIITVAPTPYGGGC